MSRRTRKPKGIDWRSIYLSLEGGLGVYGWWDRSIMTPKEARIVGRRLMKMADYLEGK